MFKCSQTLRPVASCGQSIMDAIVFCLVFCCFRFRRRVIYRIHNRVEMEICLRLGLSIAELRFRQLFRFHDYAEWTINDCTAESYRETKKKITFCDHCSRSKILKNTQTAHKKCRPINCLFSHPIRIVFSYFSSQQRQWPRKPSTRRRRK